MWSLPRIYAIGHGYRLTRTDTSVKKKPFNIGAYRPAASLQLPGPSMPIHNSTISLGQDDHGKAKEFLELSTLASSRAAPGSFVAPFANLTNVRDRNLVRKPALA